MTEAQIQRAVFQNIRDRGMPGVVAWAVPNNREARRTVGFRAGAADVSILHNGQFFALELKADDGTASAEQRKFIADVQLAGGEAVIAEGEDEALRILELWGVVRRDANDR